MLISTGDYIMKIDRLNIENIPSIIWGEKSNKVFIAILITYAMFKIV